jgi:uncharacterized protein YecE (DUF72 family)
LSGQVDFFDDRPARGKVAAAPVSDEVRSLAGHLPHGVRFGTSTWSFPGWQGLVYGGDYDETKLSREGLSAYAHHPLLRSVGVDRSYYRPLDDKTLLRMASAVPTDFKFLLKAHAALMLPKSARRPDYLAGVSDVFLDSTYASRNVIEPALRQLGEKLGVILFQFSPLGDRVLRYRKELLERLEVFLAALPSEAQYAVEWRDATLLGPDLADVLARCKVAHGYAGHPRMPQIDEQVSFDRGEGPLVIRWLLRRDRVYEDARMTYAPFDRLLEPDADSRRGILSLLHGAVGQGREAIVIVNNKAEGSAPLSVLQLAREWSSVG